MKVYLAFSEGHKHLLKEANARVIISYGRKHELPLGDYIPAGFNDYMIDSGGYQLIFGTSERSVNVESYCLWLHLALERHGDVIKSWVGLDNPSKDFLPSLENYEYMRKEGLTPVPVWKAYWPDDVLDYLCSEYEYIAVGGVASGLGKDYLKNTWNRVITKYPHLKVHMLGVGVRSGTAFKTFRPYSIDVSTWTAPARFGMEIALDKKQVLREVGMSDSDKQKLRYDKKFEEEIMRRAIKNLQSLETIMDKYNDPYQAQMDIK